MTNAVLLIHNEATLDPTSFSGGLPFAGPEDWPAHPHYPNNRLHFLAQIDCKALSRLLPSFGFPEEGVIQFFFDTEHFIEYEEILAARVIWQPYVTAGETLAPPTDLNPVFGSSWDEDYVWEVRAQGCEGLKKGDLELPKLGFELVGANLNEQSLVADVARVVPPEFDGRDDLKKLFETGQTNYCGPWWFWHQIGGPVNYAYDFSSPPNTDTHTLLLRLGADADRGFFQDGDHNPIIQYWIANDDLLAGRWENAFARLTDYM